MKLSLTAVSANRNFTKAFARHSDALSSLRNSLTGLDLPKSRIHTLQLVFMDRVPSHVRVIGAIGAFTQVEAGIPEGIEQVIDDQGTFSASLRDAVLRAISDLLIPSAERDLLIARVKSSMTDGCAGEVT